MRSVLFGNRAIHELWSRHRRPQSRSLDRPVNNPPRKAVGFAVVVVLLLSSVLLPAQGAAAQTFAPLRAAAIASGPGGSFVALPASTVFSSSIPPGGSVRFSPPGVPGRGGDLADGDDCGARGACDDHRLSCGCGCYDDADPDRRRRAVREQLGGGPDVRRRRDRHAQFGDRRGEDARRRHRLLHGRHTWLARSVRVDRPVRALPSTVIAAHATRTVTAAGVGGVPATAAIVLANLTVAASGGTGVVTAFPAGTAAPSTQSLVFTAGRPQAALSAVRVSSAGQLTILNNSSVPVTVAVDVVGYFLTGLPTVAAAFTKAAPATLFASTVAGLSAVTSKVAGVAAIPAAGVSAVVVQLSASGATGTGNLTGYRPAPVDPQLCTVPFVASRAGSNMVIVPVGANGSISVYNSSAAGVTVRADVVGYYLGTSKISWAAPRQINTQGPADLSAMSCTSATFCMARDSRGFFRFNGTAWTRVSDNAAQLSPAWGTFRAADVRRWVPGGQSGGELGRRLWVG